MKMEKKRSKGIVILTIACWAYAIYRVFHFIASDFMYFNDIFIGIALVISVIALCMLKFWGRILTIYVLLFDFVFDFISNHIITSKFYLSV